MKGLMLLSFLLTLSACNLIPAEYRCHLEDGRSVDVRRLTDAEIRDCVRVGE